MAKKDLQRQRNHTRKCRKCFCYTESVWRKKCISCGEPLPPIKWHKLTWLENIKRLLDFNK